MIITDTAMVIPICGKHYHYMYQLIEKLKKNEIKIDMYLIFSNENDYREFKYKDEIKEIIIKDMKNTMSVVTFKKLYGLRELINKEYDYFIVCDAEIDIIPENFTQTNITDKIKLVFSNKKIFGGRADNHAITEINEVSANLYTVGEDHNKLREETKNFNIYFWWSDIPVYKRDHLIDFLAKINFDKNFNKLIHNHFDYIIYQYYLILTKGFIIVDYTEIIHHKWSIEKLFVKNDREWILDKLNDMQYGFSWITKSLFNDNKDYFIKKNTFIIYHLDRNY